MFVPFWLPLDEDDPDCEGKVNLGSTAPELVVARFPFPDAAGVPLKGDEAARLP